MPTYAEVIDKGPGDKTVIHNVRTWMKQPFQAPDWLDLRVGFLLSITRAADDDNISNTPAPNIIETIPTIPPTTGFMPPEGRFWIGVKDRSAAFPQNGYTGFIGFTNTNSAGNRPDTPGDSMLVSSDIGVGTTDANFYRPKNSRSNNLCGGIFNGGIYATPNTGGDGTQIHLAQNAVGAGGYATLLMLRLQRDNTTTHAKRITATTKTSGHSADVLFTNTPTEGLLRTNLASFPATVHTWGPVDMQFLPDCLYLYWPFSNSRIRIHAAGILKAR